MLSQSSSNLKSVSFCFEMSARMLDHLLLSCETHRHTLTDLVNSTETSALVESRRTK